MLQRGGGGDGGNGLGKRGNNEGITMSIGAVLAGELKKPFHIAVKSCR